MANNAESSEFFSQIKAAFGVIVREPPKFDLESYLSNYEGRTRLYRLNAICRTSTYLAYDAVKAAIIEAKQGKDTNFYQQMVGIMQLLSPSDPLATLDQGWLTTTDKRVQMETDRLEQELKAYRNNLIKESIRMGNEDLGQHYYLIGDYASSNKAYSRMRDYCTTPKHVAEMWLRVLLVSVAQRSWVPAQSNALKITGSVNLSEADRTKVETVTQPVLALSYMAQGNYKEAAEQFLKCRFDFVTAEPQAGVRFQKEVLTGNDVAVYGGLCALATLDRAALQRRVLENSDFRQFLELEPHLRRAISMFCGSKYSTCLGILESYTPDYLMDVYLQDHFHILYSRIRSKSIVQYFIPFSVVTLDEMQNAFPTKKYAHIEEELVEMIQSGMLDAKLDLVDRLLVSPTPSPRQTIQAEALRMASSYERTLRLKLLRLNMQAAGLEVKSQHKSGNPNMAGLLQDNDTWNSDGGRYPTRRGGLGGGGGARMI